MLKIKVINKSPFLLPSYATLLASGMDLRADLSANLEVKEGEIVRINKDQVRLTPGTRVLFPTGLFIALPKNLEAQIRNRSGLTLRTGLEAKLGTIDADYRGNVGVIIHNSSSFIQDIQHGERIAQMVIGKPEKIEWEEVKDLPETVRGEGGFGHTGRY